MRMHGQTACTQAAQPAPSLGTVPSAFAAVTTTARCASPPAKLFLVRLPDGGTLRATLASFHMHLQPTTLCCLPGYSIARKSNARPEAASLQREAGEEEEPLPHAAVNAHDDQRLVETEMPPHDTALDQRLVETEMPPQGAEDEPQQQSVFRRFMPPSRKPAMAAVRPPPSPPLVAAASAVSAPAAPACAQATAALFTKHAVAAAPGAELAVPDRDDDGSGFNDFFEDKVRLAGRARVPSARANVRRCLRTCRLPPSW